MPIFSIPRPFKIFSQTGIFGLKNIPSGNPALWRENRERNLSRLLYRFDNAAILTQGTRPQNLGHSKN
jgi:hypothetical protein